MRSPWGHPLVVGGLNFLAVRIDQLGVEVPEELLHLPLALVRPGDDP